MIAVDGIDARVVRVDTRLPFRYGIAEMTVAPHVVVEVRVTVDGVAGRGWASEQLPPKWFTKDPRSSFADDLAGLVGVIEHAVDRAHGARGESVFDLWMQLDSTQTRWAASAGVPGLLAGLGTALVERALIDAFCRTTGAPFVDALHDGTLGFAPERLHPEVGGRAWQAVLERRPVESIGIRHTIGFADPLTDGEVVLDPGDGLPVSLESVLAAYGVTYLKVKTAGDAGADRARLARIFGVCAAAGVSPRLTVDGNESMRDPAHLASWAGSLLGDPALRAGLEAGLVAVEQPLHRDVALTPEVSATLLDLAGAGVPVIIDESDSDVHAVRRALDLGYAGGTYKGCKGVFRGLANAVLVAHRAEPGRRTLMTAEDLATLPPLTVGQDLVVASVMGLRHVERNGHHYFGRFAPLSPGLDVQALAAHPDLYTPAPGGASLRIESGVVSLTSALRAPFGFGPELDVSALPALSLAAARAAS